MDNLSQILLLGLGVSLPLFVSTCRGSGTYSFQDSDPSGSRAMWPLPYIPAQPVAQTSALRDPVLSMTAASPPDLKRIRGVSDASTQVILSLWIMSSWAPKPHFNPQHALY